MSEKSTILDSLVLSAAGKRVRAQLTDAELKELLKTPAMDAKAALQRLDDLPRPIEDKAIVACIMALQKSRASEGEFQRAFGHIKLVYTDYAPAWLKGARDLCLGLIEAKELVKSGGVGAQNIVNFSGFRSLVQYTLDGLEQINGRDPKLFRHGSEVARIVTVFEEDSAAIQTLNLDQFMAAVPVHFDRKKDKKLESASIPLDVAKKVYNSPDLPLPYLSGMTRFPVFGEDGALQNEAGYSKETMTYYAPPVGLEIPAVGGWHSEAARKRDLEKAKRILIEELLADFPFDGWSRTKIVASFEGRTAEPLPPSLFNALAVLLTPFVRSMVAGPVPLTLVTKPLAGTGATYLVESLQMIVSGIASARAPLAKDEDERRKALFAAVQASEAVVLYDNQKGTLDSASLASVLTSNTFTDRVLGRSEERRLPVRSVFTTTSNNLLLSDELQRRVSLVRLDAQTADPKSRSGWKHPSLHAWIESNRAQLLWACLTLVASWVHRGCQGPRHCPAVPSYGGWCYVLGGIFESAAQNWTTFQHNRDDIGRFADSGEGDGMGELIAAWAALGGEKTATDLCAVIESESLEIDGVKLNRDGLPSPVSLGRQLGAYAGRRFNLGGHELELSLIGERQKAKVWALVDHGAVVVDGAAVAASGPLVPPSYRGFPLHADPVKASGDAGGDAVAIQNKTPLLADTRARRGSRGRLRLLEKAPEAAKRA